jgi:hypothetical protein
MWPGATTAALIKQDNPEYIRVKETSMTWITSGPGATMQKNQRNTGRITAFLDVQYMRRVYCETVFNIGLNRRIEFSHADLLLLSI